MATHPQRNEAAGSATVHVSWVPCPRPKIDIGLYRGLATRSVDACMVVLLSLLIFLDCMGLAFCSSVCCVAKESVGG